MKSGSHSALIFDMDGTMVDNMMVHHKAWQTTLANEGISMTLDEVREKVHGVNIEILERLFGERFSLNDRKRMAWQKEENYRSIFKDQLELIGGLQDFLDEAQSRKIPMAIASAAPPENVEFVLDNLSIAHYFSSVLHSDHVDNGKPHPEIFLKSANALQVPIADCVIFEDSLVGAEAAKKAGAKMVLVTTTHQPEEFAHFDHIIRDIPDFVDLTLEQVISDQ